MMGRRPAVLTAAWRAAILAAIWLILSAAAPAGLLIGALAVTGSTALSLALLPPGPHPLRLERLAILLPGFIVRSLQGGIDVAWRALHPRMPIRPGWMDFDTRLIDGNARMIFGAEISLLPGTLSAGARDGTLCIHGLDAGGDLETALRPREGGIARAFSQSEDASP